MRRVVFDLGPHAFARVRDEGGGKIVMTYKNVADSKSILGTKEVNVVIDDYESGITFLKACGLELKAEQESYRETWKFEESRFVLILGHGFRLLQRLRGRVRKLYGRQQRNWGFRVIRRNSDR